MNYRELAEKIKTALHEKEQKKSLPASGSQTRSYAAPSRVPQRLPTQPASTHKGPRKADVVSKEWNSEVRHTSDFSSQIDSYEFPGSHLIPERVHRWNIKNYSAMVKKMKDQPKPKEQEMTSKVSQIKSAAEAQVIHEDKKQDELWRDMMKTQEERQFQITRITNFFT